MAASKAFFASIGTLACCCILAMVQLNDVSQQQQSLLQTSAKSFHHSVTAAKMKQLAHSSSGTKKSFLTGVSAMGDLEYFKKIKQKMEMNLGLRKLSTQSKRSKAIFQKKAVVGDAGAAGTDADFDAAVGANPELEDVEPVKNTVYVYAGRETKPHSAELTAFILQSGFGIDNVGYINSASDADIRSATWDEDCRAIIFPALKDIPDFGANAVKDIKAFVSQGGHTSGTVLFLGSPVEVHLINEMFGFELLQDYKEGPYYKNGRYATTSVWNLLPSRARELGQTESLGFLESTLPPESRSYYDSFGDSVASCTRYDLGRVCYLAQDFTVLEELPELLQNSASEDAGVAAGAANDIESLERATDTWLAIFQAMLQQSESDIAPE